MSSRIFFAVLCRCGFSQAGFGHFDNAIESEMKWLRNAYPKRPLKLKATRPDVRQLTLAELV